MNVILTIDVESYTGNYERDVYAEGHGLPFILEACGQGACRATHFVEALGATRWGIAPLRRICSDIQSAGHEVQLHVHPVVAQIDGFEDQEDVLHHRDRDTQMMLLREGVRLLNGAGVKEVTSFRAGDFAASEDTLSAMEALGLLISSNRDLDQKSSIRSQLNDAFPIRNDISRRGDMIDIPVHACLSPFPFLDRKYRHMEISAMGLREMCDALIKMQKAGYGCACILTHPGEFFRWKDGCVQPIAKNQRRLRGIVDYVAGHDDLSWATISECVSQADFERPQPPEIRLNPLLSAGRVFEQVLDRLSALK
ncbi:MAG: hypothetical protein O3C57_01580 [Verrucomicrobia bacterium]|nr:hypothetical protein [Verrucomicrobiota bacterium]